MHSGSNDIFWYVEIISTQPLLTQGCLIQSQFLKKEVDGTVTGRGDSAQTNGTKEIPFFTKSLMQRGVGRVTI